jgi:hypothetical protein
MLERALTLSVFRDRLAASVQLVLVGEQAFQSNRSAGMKLAVADAQFSA